MGRPFLAGFQPLSLESALPVRMDQDDNLVIQARPGKWIVRFRTRATSNPQSLTLEDKAAKEVDRILDAHTVEALPEDVREKIGAIVKREQQWINAKEQE